MSFIRPEAKALLRRWRDVLIGIAVACVGLMWAFGAGGILGLIGPVVAIVGGALIWTGWYRGRFANSGQGPGSVQVVEGQVIYFGPLAGGAISLGELERLTLDGAAHPPAWRLEQPGVPDLSIPLDAHGADALFDAFARLPGLRTARMLAEMEADPVQSVVIWERHPMRPADIRLH